MKKEVISIVVPCYNEQDVLNDFYHAICHTAAQMPQADFEMILVDDGSRDHTLDIIKSLAAQDSRILYLSFSRNFGKEAGLLAGLKSASGDYVAVMDADLQDPPGLLPEMYRIASEEGYDCVATRRATRKGESPVRSFFARTFYRIINRISQTEIVDGARDYRLMNRKFVNALLELGEYNRFSKGLFGWVGFRTKWLSYDNVERAAGTTKWSFRSLLRYAVEGILAFSDIPLTIVLLLGILCAGLALLLAVCLLIAGRPAESARTCLLLFLSGVQLACMGILGQYLSKIYWEVKRRPIYIVRETNVKPAEVRPTV